MPDLRITDLVVEHVRDGFTVRALDGLDAHVRDGELALLLGPSGSGKSTLLSCLGGLLTPTSGSIEVDGREVTRFDDRQRSAYRRSTVGYVFQAFNLVPSLSATDNVAAPLMTAGVRPRVARRRAEELLELVDMGEHARRPPTRLSGGQQQRVAVARALAHDPPLLLADEPTANLDYTQAESVILLLRELAAPGRTVLVSTHDDRLLPISDRHVDLVPRLDADVVGVHDLADGEVVFHQGDRGSNVFVVVEGWVEIVQMHADGTEVPLATVGAGSYFGELGPMMGQPRSATARAAGPARVEAMSLQAFRATRRDLARPASA